ncbi:MAG: hypothetical protein JJU27_19075, partial [Gammaproteobacteria bacterium]|nr:hypothetical protein [Gammaproteobacteria bacterium]
MPQPAPATEPQSPSAAAPAPENQGNQPQRPGVASVCVAPDAEGDEWIDQLQRGMYYGVCGSAYWFDGLFGTARYDLDSGDSYGRFGVFPAWDRRDGVDTRVRFRARFVLPAMQERVALVVGRGDRQDITEESASSTGTPVPPSFRRIDDDEWLVGLAYAQRGVFENGFDVGTGIRLSTPLDPYVKAGYRHHFGFGEST